MRTNDLSALENAILGLLEDDDFGGPHDGWRSPALHIDMARAAAAVYDSAAEIQKYIRDEGLPIGG